MTVGQKASLSLLIAVLLFAALTVAAFSGLFSIVESDFFSPSLSRGFESALTKVAEASKSYHESNLLKFSSLLGSDAMKRSFLPNSSAEDAQNRAFAFGKLQEDIPGLSGLRIVDSGGRRIQFSSIPGDVLNRNGLEFVYRNYGDPGDPPFSSVEAPQGAAPSIRLDAASSGFIYSLPFVDSFGDYRGTALFYVAVDGLESTLVKDGLDAVGDTPLPVGGRGILFRAPLVGRDQIAARVAEIWAGAPAKRPLSLAVSGSGDSFVLFTESAGPGGYVGFLVPSSAFVLPSALKWLLLASFFATAYLLAFLLLNLRQDGMAALSDRIKRFQITLLEEYVDSKSDIDFDRWRRELEARRSEVRSAIRRSVGRIKPGRTAEIDELIDKSWDEILAVLGGRAEGSRGSPGSSGNIDLKDIERLLAEAFKNGRFVLPAEALVQGPSPAAASAAVTKPAPAAASAAVARPAPGATPEPRPAQAPHPVPRVAPEAAVESEEAVEELEEATAVEVEELEEATAVEVEELEEAVPQVAEGEHEQSIPSREAAPQAPLAVEEAEELEEAEAVEELEEAVPQLAEGEHEQSITSREAAPQAPLEAEEAEELEEAEAVEEAEEAV
ncbi:MAG: hypothetical protein M0Z80_04995, partial [Treponema sp.]|nr:hypothetical protein [Treponema sp.]